MTPFNKFLQKQTVTFCQYRAVGFEYKVVFAKMVSVSFFENLSKNLKFSNKIRSQSELGV